MVGPNTSPCRIRCSGKQGRPVEDGEGAMEHVIVVLDPHLQVAEGGPGLGEHQVRRADRVVLAHDQHGRDGKRDWPVAGSR